MKYKKIIFSLILTFISFNALAEEFSTAFGIELNAPYKNYKYKDAPTFIVSKLESQNKENFFHTFSISLNKNDKVNGIYAVGDLIGTKYSCQEAMFGLSEKFLLKYKENFKRNVESDIVEFENDKSYVSFQCIYNNIFFTAFLKWTTST